MSQDIVPFARIRGCVDRIFAEPDIWPEAFPTLYVIRTLHGRVRIGVPESVADDPNGHNSAQSEHLRRIAGRLREALGPHAYPCEASVLYVPAFLFDRPGRIVDRVDPCANVFFIDRFLTGHSWWTKERNTSWAGSAKRYVLYSVKGGVGRSTTIAVLARHLGRAGKRVMVVDLDMESPGVSSELLSDGVRPDFGIVDWFVEDLVGQGDQVLERMGAIPSWSLDLPGEVRVIPAHGSEPEEFLAKLGRVYLHATDEEGAGAVSWTSRLGRMLSRLEERHRPDVVLLESRSGLSDMAASAVNDFDARVLLFAVNSESTWENCRIVFRHWQDGGMAAKMRGRLSLVSALTPGTGTDSYLERFRERAGGLFRDFLQDGAEPPGHSKGEFAPGPVRGHECAAHIPVPIFWTEGLAAGALWRNWEHSRDSIQTAYGDFLNRFDMLAGSRGKGRSPEGPDWCSQSDT